MNRERELAYTNVLKKELVPAYGCTEPIAVAYASALARDVLGEMPLKLIAECSGNIIKNVKGVIVPGTGNLRGVEVSAVLGAVGGDAGKRLEVLQGVSERDLERAKELLQEKICEVKLLKSRDPLHIRITAVRGAHSASVEIRGGHTQVVSVVKDGEKIVDRGWEEGVDAERYPAFTMKDIVEYADTVNLDGIGDVLRRQVQVNERIAAEGLSGEYGANVGRTLMEHFGSDVWISARACAAAGSDARMSGCTMPVIINSGSGNQGLAASLPVAVYAGHYGIPEERMLRALAVSNLTAIYQKSQLGRLSAFCGAVCAACGSGAGIAYLMGEPLQVIGKTVVNTLANVGGMVCDGAKPSCAAKISSAVEAALSGYYLAKDSKGFESGEGLVKENVDKTVQCIMRMGCDGMKQTDEKILELMTE